MSESDNGPAVYVENLQKTFGDGENAVTAVDGLSFEIERGDVVGLLGPNGAGKTTAIKSMLGLVIPDAGTVKIAGIDVYDDPKIAYNNIGAILEGARNVYWRLTVRENLAFFAGLGGDNPTDLREKHETHLEQFGLTDCADTTVNELSRGMKQKVSLASTLARDVEVIFLDEPTLGLDIETSLELRSELSQLADQEDVTIILCSHDMDVIEDICDRVIILNEGKVVEYDTVDALLELFQTSQYEITVNAPDKKEIRRKLERYDGVNCTNETNHLIITVTTNREAEIFDVMNALEKHEPDIRNIRTVDPDLEEVFLRLVESNSGHSNFNGKRSSSNLKNSETKPKGKNDNVDQSDKSSSVNIDTHGDF
ncbi:ABC transporter ATP-binding protein [Haloarcula argentinensis]|uniref:ABC transporter ATP-binding protein n=1 Tax=Haloarcula argentinensis TaxID=43776 RepID=A0A830FJ10_HALAR|nr:ABC transporter ATP-binding protein [Haloarcula argentinensis]EMA26831.1 ABC transporter [Haloarcula argentinensis DSM 12282]MDS0255781.1 ABC transporter ATP-binding protein [Haloarcula argentinensis]GGM51606.1 daunorubicin resistance protein DrrA family ABC transporter ATP-binding protein [Haloarcula argentinensis]